MKRVTILGNNSGRNAGDMAILGNMLRDISELYDDVEFWVPTINKKYIEQEFGKFNVKGIPMMPWNLSYKNLGWPLYRSMTDTDLILICDNILFDRKFYNPLFNNLSSIALFAPFAKRKGIPIVLYNVSVGPIDFPYGKKAIQKVLDATDQVITRDTATKEIFDNLDLNYPELTIHADCAMNTVPPSEAELDKIIAKEGLFTNPKGTIGFNVNAYIDNWSMDGSYSREAFCKDIAGAADQSIEALDVDILFIVTQHMDMAVTEETIGLMKHKARVKIFSNKDLKYNYEVITGIISRLELHNGLRTHPLIFSAAMNIPMIGLTSYPKSAGFLRTVGMYDWQLPFADLNADSLAAQIIKLFGVRKEVAAEMKPVAEAEKAKAKLTATFLAKYLA
ncbi:MAG: polysaccharide pyruvyl transferase family protein [Arenicellales bacterium]